MRINPTLNKLVAAIVRYKKDFRNENLSWRTARFLQRDKQADIQSRGCKRRLGQDSSFLQSNCPLKFNETYVIFTQ